MALVQPAARRSPSFPALRMSPQGTGPPPSPSSPDPSSTVGAHSTTAADTLHRLSTHAVVILHAMAIPIELSDWESLIKSVDSAAANSDGTSGTR